MPRFLKVFAFIGALFFTGNLFAAGYTCPAYVMYSSCNSGYYMTRTSSTTDTTHYGTPVAGNDCKACMSGYTCAGGTAAPVAATRSCGAGTYWNGSACANCGGNAYYCPGFTNVSNPSSGYGRNSVASGYYSTGGSETTRTGQAACGGNNYYCSGGVRNTVTAGYYSTGGDANTRTGQAACGGNAYWCSGGVRNGVSGGYYTTGGTATTRTGQAQCTGATYCSGGVSNGCPTNYTANTAAGKTAASQCQIRTTAGYYIATANATSQTICEAGYYCPAATVNYGSTGSRGACPSGYTANTATGKSAISQCTISVAAGKYLSTVNTTTTGTCAAGTYKAAHTVAYGSTSACSACSGRTQYSAAGAGACSTVSVGYYTTGCNSSNNNCTGQSICTGATYCTGGVSNACPDATANKRTTFPANYYNPVLESTALQTSNGRSAITQCQALSWYNPGDRVGLYEYVNYNTSTGKYDATTSWAYDAVKAGYYLTTKSGCGSYAYYTEVKDCPAGSYCPGKGKLYCDASNSATVHTTNYGLESCPSAYPSSGVRSTSAAYCYLTTSATKYVASAGAGQVNCVAGNACPGGTTIYYTAGVGATTGGITQCTGANYSGAGASSCAACPSGYTANTNGGKTAASQCQISVTAGKYIATANTTTQTTCEAGSYCPGGLVNYGSTGSKGACTGANYSGAGASSCAACPSGYTANTASNKTAVSQCQISVTAGKYIATANTTTQTTCEAGYYCPGGLINYGSTGSRGSCTGANYSGAGSSSCAACPTGYTANTASNKTAASQCQISVSAGKYLSTVNTTTTGTCAAGTAKAAHVVNYGSTSSCDACTGATYAAAGAGSCSSCPSGYAYNTASNKTAASQCQLRTDAGKYIATANSATQTTCEAAYYCPAATINYGSTGGRSGCPTGYTANTATGKSAISQCTISVAGGKYIASANTATQTNCAAGTSKAAHTVAYGSTSACAACTGATYSGAAAASCSSCPTNYTANTTSNKTAASQCQFKTSSTKWIATANATTESTCTAGYACPGNVLVNYGSTGGATQCTGTNYAGAGAAACSACPANYTANTTAGKTAASQCQFKTTAGNWIATANATTQATCTAGYACAGNVLIAYGGTGGRTQCSGSTYAGEGASSCSSCPAATSGWTLGTGTGWTSYTSCNQTLAATSVSSYCAAGTLKQVAASATTWGSTTIAAALTAKAGAYVNGQTCGQCAAGTFQGTNGSTATSCTSCNGSVYSGAGAASCTSCPAATSGWTLGTGTGWTSYASCNQTRAATSVSSYCAAGQLKQVAASATTWGTPSISAALTAKAGAYVNGQTCTACGAGTFQPTAGSTATSCTACVIGSYSAANAAACTACQNGTTTSAAGKASCDATCANKNAYATNWTNVTWTNNAVANLCTVSGCSGGYYVDSNACEQVGAGYWSAANSGARTQCASGLTTVGYGAGADEEADCGRVLNVGSEKLYLRSAKKTTPSLNVNVGGTTYYGNMDTSSAGKLKLNSGSTTYSVYDDSMK